MNNACSYALLIVAFLSPFSLQAMEKKRPGKVKIPAQFAHIEEKSAKKAEIPQEIPAGYQEECKMLIDAHTHKTTSTYYNPQYKSPYYVGGKLLLEAALQNKDTQACAQLVANGSLDCANKQNLLYDGLRNGYYPFCHLLLATHQAHVRFEDKECKTPLYWVLAHGSSMPTCDLFALCNLLRQHGADINKTLRNGRSICESLAAKLNLHSFYTIFPMLVQLGISPELQDDQGFTPVHRLARSKEISTTSLMNIVIPYQVYQERKILLTLLLIQRYRKESLLGQVPRDVILKHIMPYVCPFRFRRLGQTVNQQLALLQRLLTLKNKFQRTPQDLYIFIHNSDILDPQKVEQHRDAFSKATQELMAALEKTRK